jgi:hypothetical protein
MLANGVPWPKMEVATRQYRFRVLNGSNARLFQLALSNAGHSANVKTHHLHRGARGCPSTCECHSRDAHVPDTQRSAGLSSLHLTC